MLSDHKAAANEGHFAIRLKSTGLACVSNVRLANRLTIGKLYDYVHYGGMYKYQRAP